MAKKKARNKPAIPEKIDAHDAHDPAVEREVALLASTSRIVAYTRGEVDKQLMYVEDLMIQGAQPRRIHRVLRGQWTSITLSRVQQQVDKIKARWMEERARTKDVEREAAIRRITMFREWASGKKDESGNWIAKPNHGAIVDYERLLMDLQGTREAIKIDVTATYTAAMLQVVARLDGDEASEILEEARETERLAGEARRLLPALTSREVVDVEGVSASGGE